MFDRTTGRTSIRSRLGALLGATLLLSSVAWTFAPTVLGAGPLTITNVDSPDPVKSSEQILYTIVVTNTGGAKVSNVVLTDQINGVVGFGNPPLLDVVSTRGGCTQTNTQITCNAGSIEGTGTWTVTVRGIVTAAGGTTINNIATVVATKSAQTYTTSASASTQVQSSGPGGPSPDLTIGKNGPLQVTPGTGITYTLTVNNIGTANALGIKVTDTVPAAITGLSVSATSLFACAFAGQTLTCTGGRVNAGANGTITVNGTVAAAAAGDLENTSVVDPDNTIDEGILGNTADAAELNNFSNTVVTHVTPVPPPPANVILFDKQGPATAIPNELIQYTLTMTNGNVGRADYITMTDGTQGLQAASLRVVSATSQSGTTPVCTVSAPTVTCTMTRLGVNDKFIVVIEGMVVASAGSTIINSAAVNANVKNKGYTERDEVQTIVNAGRDLTISKSDLPDPVCASSWPDGINTNDCRGGLTYTFLVGNSGVQDANSVLVRDPLPPGTTYDDAATDALNAAIGAGDVTCNEVPVRIIECTIPVLEAGTGQTIKIVLTAPAALGTITNTVTVDPSNSVFESDETNNIAVEQTAVATGIDLTIKKDDETNDPGDAPPDFNVVNSLPGFDPIATSGTQTYRIVVDNKGTQNATGIHVRDILPAGTIFLTAEEVDLNGGAFPGLHGFTCSHDNSPTGGVVDCIGGSLLGSAAEFYFPPAPGDDKAFIEIKVFARPTVGLMHNEVRVDPLNQIAEYDETNNIEFEDTTVINGDVGQGAFNELSITKHSTPETNVATSSVVTYTIVVTNTGSDPAVNVVMRDTLPAGFVFQSAADSAPGPNAFLCALNGTSTVECSGATIQPGALNARTITIVTLATAVPGTWTNLAFVDPNNAIPEGNETNNAAQDSITVEVGTPTQYIDLTIAKTDNLAATAHVAPNGLISYELTVTNAGTQPAFGVVVRDAVPAGTTFVSASDTTTGAPPGQFICTLDGGNVVNCLAGTVDGTAPPDLIPSIPNVRTITVVVRAPIANVTILNQASVDPTNTIPEGNETNNTASDTTAVQSNIDLELDKTGPGSATQGSPSAYDITVKNLGTQDATNVLVRDPLPVGLIPLGITVDDSNFNCQVLQNPVNLVECVGTLQNAATDPDGVKIHIDVFVTQDGGTLDNEACVDPDDTILEFSTNASFNPDGNGNNCKTKITVVAPPIADLSVVKSASSGTVAPGADLTYTINVQNNGTGTAQSPVTVTDILPGSVTLVTATATNGWTCTGTTTIDCTDPGGGMAPGASSQITIDVKVKTNASAPIPNTATVPADPGDPTATPPIDPESNTGNNSSSVTTNVSGSGFDLAVSGITDTPDPANREEQLVYTIVAQNNGTAPTNPPSDAAIVRIEMPTGAAGVTIVGAAGTNGFNCGSTTPTSFPFDCKGDLPAGGNTIITVTLDVLIGAPDDLVLTATIDPDADFTESDEGNNTQMEVTTVSGDTCTVSPCIDLVAAEMLSSPNGPVGASAPVTYTFGVANIGDTSTGTGDAHIHFGLTGEFTGASITEPAGFDCFDLTNSAGDRSWFCDGTLGAGDGVVFVISATSGTSDGSITASGEADPHDTIDEFNETNNGPITVVTTVDVP